MDTDVFYQMPAFPTLIVNDLVYSTRWYQDVLNFQLVSQMPGPGGRPMLSHLRWTKYADLMLKADASGAPLRVPRGTGVMLTFTVVQNSVDDIAERAREKGHTQVSGPHNRPWNAREAIVLDPDGYRLTFTELRSQSLKLSEMVDQIMQQEEALS